MLSKLLEKLTGKDDLERVACKEDMAKLSAYLKTRRVLVPRRPSRVRDAASFNSAKLLEEIKADVDGLKDKPFEPWILEVEGRKHLPVFSSQRKLEFFVQKISQETNQLLSVGAGEFLVEEVIASIRIDFIELNAMCERSWEIAVKAQNGEIRK